MDALALERFTDGLAVVDATLGEGGHAREILARLPDHGKLIGLERDRRMLAALTLRDPRLTVVEGNFREIGRTLNSLGFERVHGILADIGVSGRHYHTPEWGFSFADGPLDMRLGTEGPTAADIVSEWNEERLSKLLTQAGERRGRKIAKGLVEARKKGPITRTAELAGLVAKLVGETGPRGRGTHPATKVFRALREEVTGELADLAGFIPSAASILTGGGRIVILTYTWEEERIVRKEADALVKGCICPPRLPECRCGRVRQLRWIARKGVRPTEREMKQNPSARSAKLYIVEKI